MSLIRNLSLTSAIACSGLMIGCGEQAVSTTAKAPDKLAAWVVGGPQEQKGFAVPFQKVDPKIAAGNLASHHDAAVSQFVSADGFGFSRIRSMEIRHGYVPNSSLWANQHGYHFSELNELAGADAGWDLSDLQLAGFLKDQAGVVYQIPMAAPAGMADLPKYPTRPLNDFETEAVAKLKEGKSFAAFVEHDTVKMMGAIRLTATCTQCHKVPDGTMMGAFSYVFTRRAEPYQAPTAPVRKNVETPKP